MRSGSKMVQARLQLEIKLPHTWEIYTIPGSVIPPL